MKNLWFFLMQILNLLLNINLPDGDWDVLVDENVSGIKPIKTLQKKVTLNSSTGIVLKKK